MLAWPERSDFTSVPVSSMPASQVSSIRYSKRARRFSTTVLRPSSFLAAMALARWSGRLLGGLRLQQASARERLVHGLLAGLREGCQRQPALGRVDHPQAE